MTDPKDVSTEASDGGSIGVHGMRLWMVVTVVVSGDDVSV